MNRKKILLRIWIIAVILLGWWRFWHFVVQDVPLGYDPGIYREYFLKYSELNFLSDTSSLPDRMQRVFPPFLWILAAVIQKFWILSLDRSVSWWVGIQSALISMALYFLLSWKDKRRAVVVALLSWISFVQYQVFWRNYMKQLTGMFFLLITLGLWLRGKIWLSFPLVFALSIVHRPWLLVIWILWVFRVLSQWVQMLQHKLKYWVRWIQQKSLIGELMLVAFVVLLLHPSIYPWFLQEQIASLFKWFLNSIDTPNFNDSFKSGWTFLTTWDLIKTNLHVLLLSLIGFVMSIKDKGISLLKIWWIFGTVRVFAQFSFYQRMMGYADLFWLVFSGLALLKIRDRKKWVWVLVWGLFFLGHASIFSYRVNRTWRPIMVAQELEFFKTLPSILPDDAIVMNTDSLYSAWLNGRSERPTISPWLFDLDERNKSEWEENRWTSDGSTKCEALQNTYWNTYQDLYIWQWSKQYPNDFTWWDCFEVFQISDDMKIPWTMYRVRLGE